MTKQCEKRLVATIRRSAWMVSLKYHPFMPENMTAYVCGESAFSRHAHAYRQVFGDRRGAALHIEFPSQDRLKFPYYQMTLRYQETLKHPHPIPRSVMCLCHPIPHRYDCRVCISGHRRASETCRLSSSLTVQPEKIDRSDESSTGRRSN